eukprot:5929836-Prorocentrum_lima.AAC.1
MGASNDDPHAQLGRRAALPSSHAKMLIARAKLSTELPAHALAATTAQVSSRFLVSSLALAMAVPSG